jgi:hypothetical protein
MLGNNSTGTCTAAQGRVLPSVHFCLLFFAMSCGGKGTQENTRGPASTNRDPRGTVEYCSDPERSKADPQCGAKAPDPQNFKITYSPSENITVSAGDDLVFTLQMEMPDGYIVETVTASGIKVEGRGQSIPSQSTAANRTSAIFCVIVPANVAAGDHELTLVADGIKDPFATAATNKAADRPAQLSSEVKFRITARAAGATGPSQTTACRNTTINTASQPDPGT